MDWNLARRARERGIAAEIASSLFEALKPAMDAAGPNADPGEFMEKNLGLVAHIFALASERHNLANEVAAARVFSYIAPVLADLRRRFDRLNGQLDAAVERMN